MTEPVIGSNICPTDHGLIIYEENGERLARQARFGFKRKWGPGHNFRFDNLLPATEDNMSMGLPVYQNSNPANQHRNKYGNPQFWDAFSNQRFCIVVMTGFIEFDKVFYTEEVELKTKTKLVKKSRSIPYKTELKSGELLGCAGLWEMNELGEYQFSIGTTNSNALVEKFNHDRFPVFLSEDNLELWLSEVVGTGSKIKLEKSVLPAESFRSAKASEKYCKSIDKGDDLLEPVGEWFTV